MESERLSLDGLIHDAQRLKELQSLPLERKIQITQARIIEFVERMGGPEHVVVSYSGVKDSTVLLDICRRIYPEIRAVYSNTGLEYPEVQHQARVMGAEFVRPKMRFDEVITTYGYPLVGKEVAEAIYYARRIRNAEKSEKTHTVKEVNSKVSVSGTGSEVSGSVVERESRTGDLQTTGRSDSDTGRVRTNEDWLTDDAPPPVFVCGVSFVEKSKRVYRDWSHWGREKRAEMPGADLPPLTKDEWEAIKKRREEKEKCV